MGYNGTGGWVRQYNWTNDASNSINITASRMDNETNDMANNGLGYAITKDGQQNPIANLPMAGYRHTGVGAAVNLTDYARAQETQNSTMQWGGVAGGTANALTISPTPVVTALVSGQKFRFKTGAAANTTAATLSVSSIAAANIVKGNGTVATVSGDLPANSVIEVIYDSVIPGFILQNPGGFPSATSLLSGNNLSDVASSSTSRTNLGLGSFLLRPHFPLYHQT